MAQDNFLSGRDVRAAAFPISIDTRGFEKIAREPDVQARAQEIREALGKPDIVLLGVDRLDYTKGILHRLNAYGEVLDEGRLGPPGAVLVQVASPSRERVEEYRRLRDDVEVTVGRINGEHGEVGVAPMHYLHQSYPREEMAALYLAADVMLVTPLRDGMNLVAKEYVACRYDDTGALVLSEFTGAADELSGAFIVNPHDIEGLKDAIVRAATVSPAEARRRMRSMRRRVLEHDVAYWAKTYLDALSQVPLRDSSRRGLGWGLRLLTRLGTPPSTGPRSLVGTQPESPQGVCAADAAGDSAAIQLAVRVGPRRRGPTRTGNEIMVSEGRSCRAGGSSAPIPRRGAPPPRSAPSGVGAGRAPARAPDQVSDDGLLTKVPRPWIVAIRPCSRSSFMARRTVP